jgi:hypothetical protein
MHDAWLGFERVVVYLLKGKKCVTIQKAAAVTGTMPDMRKGSASAGAKQLPAMCGHTARESQGLQSKKKGDVAANGGKPLRKAETNEQTARAIERRKNDIRAIRRCTGSTG